MNAQDQDIVVQGTPICRGIAIGHPFFIRLVEKMIPEVSVETQEIEREIARYQKAVVSGREEIQQLQKRLLNERIADGVDILDTHLQMMDDPLLTTHIEDEIRKTHKNAEHVFYSLVKECQRKFDSITDPFFQERFREIQDIYRRVLRHLRNDEQAGLSDLPGDSIIFSQDITSLDTAEADNHRIAAFITKYGGAASHAAIVAKAKGIPYVSSINLEEIDIPRDSLVIVDGRTGEVIINPSPETLVKYKKLRDQLKLHFHTLTQKGQLESETYDGYKVELSANIEMHNELDMLHQYGGSGVGLFRTESTFLASESFPTEEEQFTIYRYFVERMKGLPIVIRTFDLGGDKNLASQKKTPKECNPFLGCRAIRFSLGEQEIFKVQLRAILRASAYGDVRIMFPMVSALSELLEAKAILKEVKNELISANIPIADHIRVGCMIEVPSAAITADLLAKECDFLSIGTNDLVQYALAVDRSNDALSHLYTPTHPGILRLIRLVVSEANHHNIPVTVCGEVAADPRFTPLLLGLGVHELSVASRYLPVIKNAIRNTSIVTASKLAEQALSLSSAAAVEELITNEYRRSVPEDCFYNC
ncbi:MAG: phosphoenolpyruvate--protein phosphotransferase [Parachlamydiaceae bacterium]